MLTKKTIINLNQFKNEIADSRRPKLNKSGSKKLVFNALAVVVFSGVGMAKNVEVKESIKNTSKKRAFAAGECNAAKFVAYVVAKAAGFSHEEAASISYAVYFMCMGLTEAPISQ
ncbi:hypothetical protein [Flavobacterium sandaracinum]|uniref:Uncharacterized protein n=1 Tax=Flavobacterium sandaracinum TaxID=2541733 RepID=A0A4R5D154_9FLAO|nr:hypothetical protein [Flavobacterium sandaracinum]TDE05171.1 hypothetical protein E0F91_06635 [Flavobacterium sandaracinum]